MSFHQARNLLRNYRNHHGIQRRDDLDQCPATINTTLRRLELLLRTEDLGKRRMLLLGDDDLLGIAITAIFPSAQLSIVDLDSNLLSQIKQLNVGETIEIRCCDLRLGLPRRFAHRFDLVFTDPPYTLAGQLLFLKRALTALRPVQGASLYLCASRFYLDEANFVKIAEAADRGGLQLKNIYENFNKYNAPPDVQEDLKRAKVKQSKKFLHSTLFHFVVRADRTSPRRIHLPSRNIYDYVAS